MTEVIYVVSEMGVCEGDHYVKMLKAFRNKSYAQRYLEEKCLEAKEQNAFCIEHNIDFMIVYGIETIALE